MNEFTYSEHSVYVGRKNWKSTLRVLGVVRVGGGKQKVTYMCKDHISGYAIIFTFIINA